VTRTEADRSAVTLALSPVLSPVFTADVAAFARIVLGDVLAGHARQAGC